jgi:hypothetical protein
MKAWIGYRSWQVPSINHSFISFAAVELTVTDGTVMSNICNAIRDSFCFKNLHCEMKIKLSSNKLWRLREGMECRASILTLTFGIPRMAVLSAVCAGYLLHQGKFLGTHFWQRLSGPRAYWMQTEGLGHLKIFKNPTGNWTRYLPSCGTVPQPPAPPLSPLRN